MDPRTGIGAAEKLFEEGSFQEARICLEESIAGLEKHGRELENLAESNKLLGRIYLSLDEENKAIDCLEKARAQFESNASDNTASLAESGIYSSTALLLAEKLDEAEIQAQKSIELAEQCSKRLLVAAAQDSLGNILLEKNKLDDAEACLSRALGMRKSELGEKHREVASSLHNLAQFHMRSANLTMAGPLSRRALNIRKEMLDERHPQLGESHLSLAAHLIKEGKFEKAEPEARKAAEVFAGRLPEEHRLVIWTKERLASISLALGRVDEAEQLSRAALTSAEKKWGSDHPNLASSLVSISTAYINKNDFRAAEPYLKRSLKLLETSNNLDASAEYNLIQQLSFCYLFQLKLSDALVLLPASFRAKHTSDVSNMLDMLNKATKFVDKRIKDMKKND